MGMSDLNYYFIDLYVEVFCRLSSPSRIETRSVTNLKWT